MSLYKRGKYWHFDFIYKGIRRQGSTDQTNINQARLALSAIRSRLALERLGVAPPKESPIFRDFMLTTFLEHVNRHSKAKRTAQFYREKTKRILEHSWSSLRLDAIDEVAINNYTAIRSRVVTPITVNHELATVRKALRLAVEWKLLGKAPKVRLLPGVEGRDFIVSGELEREYLSKAVYPLKEAAILINDLGLRPEECVRLRKTDITDEHVTVRKGKSKNAFRAIPLTQRAKDTIELLSALWEDSEFLFPGNKGKHLTRGALSNAHCRLKLDNPEWPKAFVLYSFRHTFGTRLAESGASVFDIKRLMGHFSVKVSERYVHPTGEGLALAMKRKEALDKMIRGEEATAFPAMKVRK